MEVQNTHLVHDEGHRKASERHAPAEKHGGYGHSRQRTPGTHMRVATSGWAVRRDAESGAPYPSEYPHGQVCDDTTSLPQGSEHVSCLTTENTARRRVHTPLLERGKEPGSSRGRASFVCTRRGHASPWPGKNPHRSPDCGGCCSGCSHRARAHQFLCLTSSLARQLQKVAKFCTLVLEHLGRTSFQGPRYHWTGPGDVGPGR
jgi:hypothetical protein